MKKTEGDARAMALARAVIGTARLNLTASEGVNVYHYQDSLLLTIINSDVERLLMEP
jgi:hypothetical protein